LIRADVIDPKITEHRRRIVKRPVMACWSNFPVSSIAAVCAEIQSRWPRVMLGSPSRNASNFE